MTLGRGGGVIRTTILVVLTAILFIAVLIVGARRYGITDADAPADPAGESVQDESREAAQSGTEETDPSRETPTEEVTPSAQDVPEASVSAAPEPAGARLQGPQAARMERWQPLHSSDGSVRAVAARSTVVDAPVRVVSLDAMQGLDAVAVRIARRRWDELSSGATADVPRIVWEPVERALSGTGELRWIHAVDDAPQAEYILRLEGDRFLLRLYGGGTSVYDVEIEALPRP